MKEKWYSVPGHPLLEVSNKQRVRSLPRVIAYLRKGTIVRRRRPGEILRQYYDDSNGYFTVTLDGNNYRVHVLVALVKQGRQPKGMVVNHKDGVKTNNHPDNLEWVTRKEDRIHALKNGLLRTKLTEDAVLEIIRLLGIGQPQSTLARQYRVTPSLICSIAKRKIWLHLWEKQQ